MRGGRKGRGHARGRASPSPGRGRDRGRGARGATSGSRRDATSDGGSERTGSGGAKERGRDQTRKKTNSNDPMKYPEEASDITPSGTFTCEKCGKFYGSRASLRTHSYTHKPGLTGAEKRQGEGSSGETAKRRRLQSREKKVGFCIWYC